MSCQELGLACFAAMRNLVELAGIPKFINSFVAQFILVAMVSKIRKEQKLCDQEALYLLIQLGNGRSAFFQCEPIILTVVNN